jgi:hypothetical protein
MRPLLTTGDHIDRLLRLVAGEQQAAQGAAHQGFDVAAFVTAGAHPLHDPFGERRLAGEVGGVVLVEGAGAGLFGPLHASAQGFQTAQFRAGQQAQQRGLADAVLADDGDLVAGLDAGREGLDDRHLYVPGEPGTVSLADGS